MIGPQLPKGFKRQRDDEAEDEALIARAQAPARQLGVLCVSQLSASWTVSVGRGLQNLGNSCFMNSVLQCLAHLPPLACAVDQGSLHGFVQCCPVHNNPGKCTCCLLQRQLKLQLDRKTASSFRPTELHGALKQFSKAFIHGRQEDAHEFLLAVLDAVERDTKKAYALMGGSQSQRTLVEDLFQCRVQSQVKCMECGYCSNTYQHDTTLSLDIGRSGSVEQSLAAYTAAEWLDGANKYKCDKCKRSVRARKGLTIFHEPNLLVVHLKRFDGFSLGKVHKHVQYPLTLDLAPYKSHRPEDPHSCQYLLTGVLVHQGGSANSGHYYAYVRDSNGSWWCANDAHVYRPNPNQVLQQQAYMLFYTKSSKGFLRPLPPLPQAPSEPATNGANGTPKEPALKKQAVGQVSMSAAGSNGIARSSTGGLVSFGPQLPPGSLPGAHPQNSSSNSSTQTAVNGQVTRVTAGVARTVLLPRVLANQTAKPSSRFAAMAANSSQGAAQLRSGVTLVPKGKLSQQNGSGNPLVQAHGVGQTAENRQGNQVIPSPGSQGYNSCEGQRLCQGGALQDEQDGRQRKECTQQVVTAGDQLQQVGKGVLAGQKSLEGAMLERGSSMAGGRCGMGKDCGAGEALKCAGADDTHAQTGVGDGSVGACSQVAGNGHGKASQQECAGTKAAVESPGQDAAHGERFGKLGETIYKEVLASLRGNVEYLQALRELVQASARRGLSLATVLSDPRLRTNAGQLTSKHLPLEVKQLACDILMTAEANKEKQP